MTRVRNSWDPSDQRSGFRLWRVALAIAPVTLLVSMVTTTAASASSVSAVTASPNPPTAGAVATYTISYTPASAQTYLGTISVVAAPGTTFTACASSCSGYTMVQGSTIQSISSVSVSAAGGSSTTNEFEITLGLDLVESGTSITILAPGTNPTTAGTDTLSLWTSADTSPASANYTIGTPTRLMQGAVPNSAADPLLSLDSPGYLQSLFGTPTDTFPTLGMDYLPSDTFDDMDGSNGTSLSYLADFAIPGYQLSLGVPIIPGTNMSPGGSLASGAVGDYDADFKTLAESLIDEGLGNSWLRLGYEFDNLGTIGPSNPWGTENTTSQLTNFKDYWIHIVDAMRSEQALLNSEKHEDTTFKFVWNPDGFAFLGNDDPQYQNSGGITLSDAWPGPKYVDYIGVDLYDVEPTPMTGYTQSENWADFVEPQLQAAQHFASNKGVPLAFPEWGVMAPEEMGGMSDDPSYINGMYCFMIKPANDVAWESYSNTSYTGWNSEITGGSFPLSLQEFQADFGEGSTSVCISG
jgi:hypothetical protein